jgi:N6-adenosine-specific RNA methylase IME4
MNNELATQDWYELLVDDCKAILVEASFTSRWAIVEGYWNLGQRINADNKNFERENIYGEKIVQRVAESLNKGQRSIWLALQFHKKYPDLEKLPEGKNVTWHDIVNKYLPAPKENKIEIPLPEGQFNVIYCDPPWQYRFSETETREIENKYPTLELDKIKALQIPASENSIIFMWATAPKLEEAMQVLLAWGFDYRTCAVWDKEIIGMGYWFRGQHELLLVGVKGTFPTPDESKRVSSVYRERRGQHSVKPTHFYNLIESYFPNGKYLELFARQKHNDKWTVWGNEV